jgi:hypothetical protein
VAIIDTRQPYEKPALRRTADPRVVELVAERSGVDIEAVAAVLSHYLTFDEEWTGD